MHRLLIQQFFNLFAQIKTITKSDENYVFLYPFSNMAISPQNNEKNKQTNKQTKTAFYTVNCMGWQVWVFDAQPRLIPFPYIFAGVSPLWSVSVSLLISQRTRELISTRKTSTNTTITKTWVAYSNSHGVQANTRYINSTRGTSSIEHCSACTFQWLKGFLRCLSVYKPIKR